MNWRSDSTFRSMGSEVRLMIGSPLSAGAGDPGDAAVREREFVEDYARRLSRFREDSELTALNRSPEREVPASPLLRASVRAAIWAAERSAGLVDPTLLEAIERVGYTASLDGATPASLWDALAGAPQRRPASPNPAARWREIEIDDERALIRRPPGLMIDTGGTGKGLAADAVAHRLRRFSSYVVDCGGDIAIGGLAAGLEPVPVQVEHPLTREIAGTIPVAGGGIATSGLNIRIWQREDGSFAHHLLSPATGEPVWSGVIGATALGANALEAETLSKIALLGGPQAARRVLAERGGLIVREDGDVEWIGTSERLMGVAA